MYGNKILALLGLFILIYTFGCKDDDSITNPETNIIYSFYGKIDNYSEGSNKNLKLGKRGDTAFYVFGSSNIEEDGSFQFQPIQPPDSILYQISGWLSLSSCETLNISDPNIKGTESQLSIFSADSIKPIGEVRFTNDTQNNGKGYFGVSYIYSEGPLDIIGYKSVKDSSDSFMGTRVTRYNLRLKKGWNYRVYTVIEKIVENNITTYYEDEWSTEITKNGFWYYRMY